MLVKAVGVDEIKQENWWTEKRPRYRIGPRRLHTPEEEHHEWMM